MMRCTFNVRRIWQSPGFTRTPSGRWPTSPGSNNVTQGAAFCRFATAGEHHCLARHLGLPFTAISVEGVNPALVRRLAGTLLAPGESATTLAPRRILDLLDASPPMSILTLPLHPRLVHFPIALLLVGAAALLVYEWRPFPWLKGWGFLCLMAGWLLTIPAIVTGLIDKSGLEPNSAANQVANLHTTLIFVAWGLYGLGLYWAYLWRDAITPRRRWQLTALLVVATLVLVVAGDLGGRLVYEFGVRVQGR